MTMNVLIADDEHIVREGLKYIIDWEDLGFSVCGDAADGEEALKKILSLNPDLVLLDIRMPKKSGMEVMQEAIHAGYSGKFIILSGVSDFKLAQTAMRCGVDFYLTKPIDEDELASAVTAIYNLIEKERHNRSSLAAYRDKARPGILRELLLGTCDCSRLDLMDLGLNANLYQVIFYENYEQNFSYPSWDFAEILRAAIQNETSLDFLELNQQKILLLKGDTAIRRFERLLGHYATAPQKGSPFDSVFLICGPKVARPEDIHRSYTLVCQLEKRRFFCVENQHILSCEDALVPDATLHPIITADLASEYARLFSGYIQSYNRTLLTETLQALNLFLHRCSDDIAAIRHLLIDIYLLVKQKIMQLKTDQEIPFPANTSAIALLESKAYLYEMVQFLAEQFDLWMNAVGYSSGENIIDEVTYYIRQNYAENLKLETIAPLFGYNSSYLGKIFRKKTGVNFNTYVDQVRIENAKQLLHRNDLKIYEISDRIGYSNVDYFHKKFRKFAFLTVNSCDTSAVFPASTVTFFSEAFSLFPVSLITVCLTVISAFSLLLLTTVVSMVTFSFPSVDM